MDPEDRSVDSAAEGTEPVRSSGLRAAFPSHFRRALAAGSERREPPSVLAGRYELRGPLGRGAMGGVHRYFDRKTLRDVAVKIAWAGAEEALRTEVRVLAELDHPSIPRALDAGSAEGVEYAVFPLLDGPTLRAVIDARTPTPRAEHSSFATSGDVAKPTGPTPSSDGPDAVPRSPTREAARALLRSFADLARALHALHVRGFVHADVKPSNVMFDASGRIHLIDFGLSDDGSTGAHGGTPPYMSPEQTADVRRLPPASDVYSLAVTLHEAMTGLRVVDPPRDLHGAARDDWIRTAVATVPPRAPSRVAPALRRALGADAAAALDAVLRKATEKDPARRYATAEAFAVELGRVADGRAPLDAAAPEITRRRAVRRGVAAVLVVAAGYFVVASRNAAKAVDAERAATRSRITALRDAGRAEEALEACAASAEQARDDEAFLELYRGTIAACAPVVTEELLRRQVFCFAGDDAAKHRRLANLALLHRAATGAVSADLSLHAAFSAFLDHRYGDAAAEIRGAAASRAASVAAPRGPLDALAELIDGMDPPLDGSTERRPPAPEPDGSALSALPTSMVAFGLLARLAAFDVAGRDLEARLAAAETPEEEAAAAAEISAAVAAATALLDDGYGREASRRVAAAPPDKPTWFLRTLLARSAFDRRDFAAARDEFKNLGSAAQDAGAAAACDVFCALAELHLGAVASAGSFDERAASFLREARRRLHDAARARSGARTAALGVLLHELGGPAITSPVRFDLQVGATLAAVGLLEAGETPTSLQRREALETQVRLLVHGRRDLVVRWWPALAPRFGEGTTAADAEIVVQAAVNDAATRAKWIVDRTTTESRETPADAASCDVAALVAEGRRALAATRVDVSRASASEALSLAAEFLDLAEETFGSATRPTRAAGPPPAETRTSPATDDDLARLCVALREDLAALRDRIAWRR